MDNTRASFDESVKWNVGDLYSDRSSYEKDYAEVEQKLGQYKEYEGHILDNAKTLLEFLGFDNEVSMKLDRIYIYSHIQNDQDTTNTEFQVLYDRAIRLCDKASEASAFATPELLKKDYSVIQKYIEDEPALKAYERMLKDVYKMKEHILSEEEEKLLSTLFSTLNTASDVYDNLTDADLKFGTVTDEDDKEVELSERTYRKLVMSTDRIVRKGAWERLMEVYSNYKNTYAKLLSSDVNANNKLAKIRGYKSALEASLFPGDIPISIYTNLIKTVKKNVAPLSNYWKLKKCVLDVDELHIYDTYAPTAKEVDKSYTLEEAKNLIICALGILGENYVSHIKEAFDKRWIDSPSNDGKRNGAYCTKCYGVHPYVLLSFDGTLNSVSTLIHELGHAMHDYYAMTNQSYQDHGYSIFVAEVASQVNQILLSRYLISKSESREEKIYLLDDLIQDFKGSIYRQTMFADFQKTIHEKSEEGCALTHEELCNLYYMLNEEYFGENIVIDDAVRYEWERIPHFYAGFYVYQYATAYAASIIIAKNILEGKPQALENYLEFLKLGSTKTPVESLRVAGVDMESETVLKDAFVYFDGLVRELEENMR